jgi:hypothetical protein
LSSSARIIFAIFQPAAGGDQDAAPCSPCDHKPDAG